jgi:hypothetical protein
MLGNRVIVLQAAAWGSSTFGLEHARSRQAVASCRRYVSDHFKSRAREARRPRAMQPSQLCRVRLIPTAAQCRIASSSAWGSMWIQGLGGWGRNAAPHRFRLPRNVPRNLNTNPACISRDRVDELASDVAHLQWNCSFKDPLMTEEVNAMTELGPMERDTLSWGAGESVGRCAALFGILFVASPGRQQKQLESQSSGW